jgi:myo-inositol catabolism protein IolS
MKKKMLGSSGVAVSGIIQGCWAMAGDYFGAAEDRDSIEAIRTSLDLGVNTFDNAELYGKGHAEEVLGRALRGVSRDKYVLISKVWTTHYSREDMMEACRGSMKRMGVDCIDVYFLHYPPVDRSIEESMENIMHLKEEGMIRAIGISNFSLAEMKAAMAAGQVDVIQPCYSLLWRYIDRDILPFCIENNIGVIPYSSLAQGLLTGTLTKDTPISDGRRNAALFQPENYSRCLDVAEFVKTIGAKYGKSTAQCAIQWLARTPGITAPIVGGTDAGQSRENVGAVDWEMSREDYDAIDGKSREFTDTMPEYELFFRTDVKK